MTNTTVIIITTIITKQKYYINRELQYLNLLFFKHNNNIKKMLNFNEFRKGIQICI